MKIITYLKPSRAVSEMFTLISSAVKSYRNNAKRNASGPHLVTPFGYMVRRFEDATSKAYSYTSLRILNTALCA